MGQTGDTSRDWGGANESGDDDGVLAAVAAMCSSIDALTEAALWSRSDAQAREGVRAGFELLQRTQSMWLGLVADLDSRPSAVAGARAGSTAKTFLMHKLRRTAGQATADLRSAHTLAPDARPDAGGLPAFGAALAAGKVSREHVDVATGALRKIPKHLLSRTFPGDEQGRCGGEVIDEFITQHAQTFTSSQTDTIAKRILAVLDPDGTDSFDPDAVDRRNVSAHRDRTGMIVGRFQLDPVNGEWFMTALNHFSAPHPTREETDSDGNRVKISDKRDRGQRQADALGEIARRALNAEEAGTRGGEPPRIVIHTSVDDLNNALRITNTDDVADTYGDHTDIADTDIADADGDDADGDDADGDEWPINELSDAPRIPNQPTRPPSENEAACADSPSTPTPAHTRTPAPAHSRRKIPIWQPETATGGLISARLLGRFTCDAVLQAVLLTRDGAILNAGRDVRTATPAQRRALVARDRGCVIPGCTAPAHACEAHHITWFRNGGFTDIANLALTCSRHHTDLHNGIWELRIVGGLPYARPPAWLDPSRPWIRNTAHYVNTQATELAEQLRLNLNLNVNGNSDGDGDSSDDDNNDGDDD